MSDRLREQIEQWRDKEKLEASRHTSSQWIWGNHMSAAKAYEKVLAALAEKPAERPADEPQVAGNYDGSFWAFTRRAGVLIKEEQSKPLPDNALIGFLCDAIRIAREAVAVAADNRAERPQLSAEQVKAILMDINVGNFGMWESFAKPKAEAIIAALLTGEAETHRCGVSECTIEHKGPTPAAPPVFQAEPDVERVPTHMERARDLTVLYDLRCERIDDPDPDWLAEEMAKEFVEVEKVAFARAAQEAENFYHKGTAIANIIRALADSPVSGATQSASQRGEK
jgi:hypothetical protein